MWGGSSYFFHLHLVMLNVFSCGYWSLIVLWRNISSPHPPCPFLMLVVGMGGSTPVVFRAFYSWLLFPRATSGRTQGLDHMPWRGLNWNWPHPKQSALTPVLFLWLCPFRYGITIPVMLKNYSCFSGQGTILWFWGMNLGHSPLTSIYVWPPWPILKKLFFVVEELSRSFMFCVLIPC